MHVTGIKFTMCNFRQIETADYLPKEKGNVVFRTIGTRWNTILTESAILNLNEIVVAYMFAYKSKRNWKYGNAGSYCERGNVFEHKMQ